jgi:hypothetical protein
MRRKTFSQLSTTVVIMVQQVSSVSDNGSTWRWPDGVCASRTKRRHRHHSESIARQAAKAGAGSRRCSGGRNASAGLECRQTALVGRRQAPFFQQRECTLWMLTAQHRQEGMGQTRHGDMTIPARPAPHFIVVQPSYGQKTPSTRENDLCSHTIVVVDDAA